MNTVCLRPNRRFFNSARVNNIRELTSPALADSVLRNTDPRHLDRFWLHVTVLTMNSGKSPSNDDAELRRRFIAGDRQALDDLFALYAPQVLAFLAARTENLADGEDLLHDVWIKAKTHLSTFDGNNFRAWIFQIARNSLYDFSKSPKQRKKPSSISEEHERGGEDDPSGRISRGEELTALQDCMNAVGGEFVEAVRRNKVDGESAEDIANDLGIDVGTIYSRIHRGKKKLLDCLEKKLK